MAEDKILRLIVGVLILLISIPALGMFFGMLGYGMMSFGIGIGFFSSITLLVFAALGIYLVVDGLKKEKSRR